ncbi:hypothetical protein ACJMK2_008301 [Sinanodonta woodiana]|uniref:Uncharacterized protein n=1 Tax=Sinanodonta woodiana TaxID=1069815 RepID=A0ABD3VL63_SINWO
MAFSMFHCIFSLMLFLHVQQATTATRIHESEGYGRYQKGRNSSPAIPLQPVAEILCPICIERGDSHCIRKFCQGGFGRYESYVSLAIPFNPTRRILCSYCIQRGDWHCILKFCQRGFGFGGYGGYSGGYGAYSGGYGAYSGGYGGYSGHYPFPRKDRCYYC